MRGFGGIVGKIGTRWKRKILWICAGVAAAALLVVAGLIAKDMILRSTYQKAHLETVSEMAEEYGLDVYLVAAVTYIESKYDPDAVSGKGAIGLMQIMPDTGEWIAWRLKMDGFKTSMLTDPQLNMRMGCWYLRYLSERYGGRLQLVLSAYNAGPGKVDSWLKDPACSKDGKTLSHIPYDETRQYVSKVLDANEQYKELYPAYR